MRLKPNHPALIEARTIHTKYVKPVSDAPVLKSVADNSKIGKGLAVILKGKWRGMPMFSLTLQERATCPPTCDRWSTCYGNGMMFAHRYEHGEALENKIRAEVQTLAAMYPHGFVVRLHVLGDFYSLNYAILWGNMLQLYPNLHIFGYTKRDKCEIGRMLQCIRVLHGERFWVRISANANQNGHTIYASDETHPGAIPCPEQTGKTQSCLDCGLCWSIGRTISFTDHDKVRKEKKNENRQATA